MDAIREQQLKLVYADGEQQLKLEDVIGEQQLKLSDAVGEQQLKQTQSGSSWVTREAIHIPNKAAAWSVRVGGYARSVVKEARPLNHTYVCSERRTVACRTMLI